MLKNAQINVLEIKAATFGKTIFQLMSSTVTEKEETPLKWICY